MRAKHHSQHVGLSATCKADFDWGITLSSLHLPLPKVDQSPCLIVLLGSWDDTSVAAKWHLTPFNGFSKLAECMSVTDRQTDRQAFVSIVCYCWCFQRCRLKWKKCIMVLAELIRMSTARTQQTQVKLTHWRENIYNRISVKKSHENTRYKRGTMCNSSDVHRI